MSQQSFGIPTFDDIKLFTNSVNSSKNVFRDHHYCLLSWWQGTWVNPRNVTLSIISWVDVVVSQKKLATASMPLLLRKAVRSKIPWRALSGNYTPTDRGHSYSVFNSFRVLAFIAVVSFWNSYSLEKPRAPYLVFNCTTLLSMWW